MQVLFNHKLFFSFYLDVFSLNSSARDECNITLKRIILILALKKKTFVFMALYYSSKAGFIGAMQYIFNMVSNREVLKEVGVCQLYYP